MLESSCVSKGLKIVTEYVKWTILILCALSEVTEVGRSNGQEDQCLVQPKTLGSNCNHGILEELYENSKIITVLMPWLVSVQDQTYDNPHHFCGGVVVDEAWVVTTAFCVRSYRPYDLKVVAGEFDRESIDGWEQFATVEEIHLHEDFQEFNFINDIALLKVDPPFVPTVKVNAISLNSNITKESYIGRNCWTHGWGMVEKSGIMSPILKETELEVIPTLKCFLEYPGLISSSNVCANVKNNLRTLCNGDWGNPLICGENELLGVASWSNGCSSEYPYVFTDISKFVKWIQEKTSSNTTGT